jgi:hypothetical protein
MENICLFIIENFFLFFGLAVIWCFACFAFFAWQRIRRGSWHPPVSASQVRFSESHMSGFSHKNVFTKFGGASKVLSVTVTNEALLVEPITLFKWIMPFGFNDLEHYIPRENIKKIEPVSRWGRDGVVIEFISGTTEPKRIELFLRHHQQFLAALS